MKNLIKYYKRLAKNFFLMHGFISLILQGYTNKSHLTICLIDLEIRNDKKENCSRNSGGLLKGKKSMETK